MDKNTEKAIKRLNSFFNFRKIKGVKALKNTKVPETVPPLISLLEHSKAKVREAALDALLSLKGNAMNHLCSLWAEGRDKGLEGIVVKGGYVPSTPLHLKYLTVLKLGNIQESSNADDKGVDILLKLLYDKNLEVVSNASQAIHSLTSELGINRLCSLWAESRDKKLEKIILKCGYIATTPPLLTAQTTFINGKNVKSLLSKDVFDTCIKDVNLRICKGTAEILIDKKGNDGYETLWALVKDNPDSSLAEALNEMKWFPNDPTERALFYLLANNLPAYHDIDFEHTYLRTWYETAGETLKQAIASRIRKSGDARLLAIFRTKRGSRKGKLAAHEVELQTELLTKEGNCPELFHLLPSATYTQGIGILSKLKEAGWTNPAPHGRELQKRLEKLIFEDEKTNLPSIYSRSMYEDFRPMFFGNEKPPESEGELLSWTNDGKSFRKRSAALITLAEKGSTKLTDSANRLCGDPYWQVRMAAACSELLNPGTLSPANKALLEGDHVYYVQAILKMPSDGRLSDGRLVDLSHDGLEELKRVGLTSDVKNNPEKADNFFDLVKGFLPSDEREYLLTLAEFMKTEVAVTEEAAYEAGEMDVEIEMEE